MDQQLNHNASSGPSPDFHHTNSTSSQVNIQALQTNLKRSTANATQMSNQTDGAFDHASQSTPAHGNSTKNIKSGNKSANPGQRKKGQHTHGKETEKQNKLAEFNKANSYFSCECQVCHMQVTKGHQFEIKKTMDKAILQGKKIPFSQLIEYLLPPNEKLKGCSIMFPDTVFFQHGKPYFIAKTDKEGCLISIQQQNKLALQEIRQKFSTIVRERKKETIGGVALLQQQILNAGGQGQTLQIAQPVPDSPPLKQDGDQGYPTSQADSIYYKDTAVFRFLDDDAVKVVRDTEFINEFRRRANDSFWDTIDCIQTVVKARTGIGHPIFVQFYAPIDEESPQKDILFNYKSMTDDVELLKNEEDDTFAYKYCLKIAYYIQKVYHYEILQMKAVFLKDENGTIWFFHAQNIQVRATKKAAISGYDIKLQSQQRAKQQQETLIKELQQYETEIATKPNVSIGRMLNIMDNYYLNMKSEMGIFDQKDQFKEEDTKLDEVMRDLRPNTTAKNFKEFLHKQDNINRNTHWKNISRKLDTGASPASTQYTPYMNKRNSHQSTSNQNNKLQGILSAIDGSQLTPAQKQELMNVILINQGGGNNQQSTTLNSSVKYNSLLTGRDQQQPHNYYSSTSQGDRARRTNLKAELVRKQLLSRSELMRLYQPPLLKSQMPTNNPFYTKTIVNPNQTAAELSLSPLQQPDPFKNDKRFMAKFSTFKLNSSAIVESAGQLYGQDSFGGKLMGFKRDSLNSRGSGMNGDVMSVATYSQLEGERERSGSGMMNWGNFNSNQSLKRKITKRMEYLKVQDTFKKH